MKPRFSTVNELRAGNKSNEHETPGYVSQSTLERAEVLAHQVVDQHQIYILAYATHMTLNV